MAPRPRRWAKTGLRDVHWLRGGASAAAVAALLAGVPGWSQLTPTPVITTDQPATNQPATNQTGPAPVTITLDEAIRRAEANEPNFATAVADKGVAALDRSIARKSFLPTATYHNQYLYTQPNGVSNAAGQVGAQAAPRFIANNSIREYASQLLVTETVGVANLPELRRADAAAAQAAAALEVARRGLVVTVVQQYYGLLSANRKLAVAQRAAAEAGRFGDVTRKLESGREVAHADVVKADLQVQQRQRDREDAEIAQENAQLELAVLLFPDPHTAYTLADDTQARPLPARAEVDAAARQNNPDLRSALEALNVSNEEVLISRAAYLPDLSLNWTYGIDAPQFATFGPVDATTGTRPRNLGYSAFATLDIPVWDWLSTHDRVKQSELRRTASQTALSYAQKKLVAELDEFYHEAEVAARQQTSLEASVDTAAESLRLTNLRYQAGEGTVLEVVDAQNALTAAEQAFADGVVRYRVALANLQTLTGVLP